MMWRVIGICAAIGLSSAAAISSAINLKIDYSYDSNGFFPVGGPARATIEAVASYYSNILTDTFSAISVPPQFKSSLPPAQNPGTINWHWTLNFDNPSAGGQITLTDQNFISNEYRIYVGAQALSGNQLGHGGPGGYSIPGIGGCCFTASENNQITSINNEFVSSIETRGETSGFAAWGGAVTFDNDASTTWHLSHATAPLAGENDLYSTAIHEFGHVLGLGASDEWNDFANGSGSTAFFDGPDASTVYGGNVPLAPDKAHWREGTMSTVFGALIAQEAALDPSIITGTRKRFTALDAAALSDIGWSVVAPQTLQGDFNGDNRVDAADYTVWRNGLGGLYNASHYSLWKSHFGQSAGSGGGAGGLVTVPEPHALLLALVGLIFLSAGGNACRTRPVRHL